MAFRFFHIDAHARRRLWWLYHLVFIILLVHFALVYLRPGYFSDPGGDFEAAGEFLRGGRFSASFVIERGDRRLLRGGDSEGDHFDISQFRLDPVGLNYGIGREHFPALIEPEFESADEADEWLQPEDKVLVVKISDEVRVYPVRLLIRHEVVNDEVEGVPIFAAYCVLADLGAVYHREIRGHELTFALSGYTYSDPDVWEGRDAFVLWDRETESLWWPPIGKAVSGPLIDEALPVFDDSRWAQTTWQDVRQRHARVKVLRRGQDFERPTDWPRLDITQVDGADDSEPASTVPPRWGENAIVQ